MQPIMSFVDFYIDHKVSETGLDLDDEDIPSDGKNFK